MDEVKLKAVMSDHLLWLMGKGGQRANLSGANLREADLSGVNLREANLRGANLSRADLSKADLRRADLGWANLRGADLSGANLSGANLSGANLSGANLSRANLSRADLSKASLRGADLSGANWDFASFPLWCGSFGFIADDRLAWQLVAHLTRLDTPRCSQDVRQMMRQIMPYANRFCEYRPDVGRLDLTNQGGRDNDVRWGT